MRVFSSPIKIKNSKTPINQSNEQFFDIKNSTKIFQKIIGKIQKDKRKKIDNRSKAEAFLFSLDKIRFNKETKENYSDFLIKELKKDIKINKVIKKYYGKVPQFFDFKRTLNKFEKNIYFSPLEKIKTYEDIKNTKNLKKNINSFNTFIKFPQILNKNYSQKLMNFPKKLTFGKNNFDEEKLQLQLNKNKDKNTNNFQTKKKNKKIGFLISQINEKNKDVKSRNKNNLLAKSNTSPIINLNYERNDKLRPTFRTITKNISSLNIKNAKLNFHYFNNYLDILDSVQEKLKNNELKHRRYFTSNDYGCELSKVKYKYINKNYFE